jgi:flavodoxin short chain
MASLIKTGAESSGACAEMKHAADASPDELSGYDAVAFGSPAMGSEGIEESEMAPFVKNALPHLAGKRVALFGSYGWGDGEWMRKWADEMKRAGISLIDGGLIVHESPEGASAEACAEWGAKLAARG